MTFHLSFLKEALSDYEHLDGSQKKIVNKALKRILLNPLPSNEGGYGKPLGNLKDSKLSGLLKIKLKSFGLRIVYKLERKNDIVLVIIIGTRADSKVYKEASKRISRNND